MNTTLTIRGKKISIALVQHAVRITTDDELTNLLALDTEAATAELVAAIKTAYKNLFNTEFAVSDSSMIVEIWGHVYADQFANWIKEISDINFIDKIADKVIYHAEYIDIGESGHDNNRFVWDGLAAFKSVIAALLPK